MAATSGPDLIASLFSPDLVLPDQLAAPRRDSLVSGERALMLAVLEDAIRCLEAPAGRGEREARHARRWVTANPSAWPFSFVNICETLGIEPARLRAALLTRHEHLAQATPEERYALHLRLKPRAARIGGRRRRIRIGRQKPEAPRYRAAMPPDKSARAITMRCTSLVPSPISPSLASRM
jgi:hypothetical protein